MSDLKDASKIRTRMPAMERRALVLAAAGRRFGADGYEGTTIDQIAAGAGVTKPIVYRHFESKKALYLELLAKHRDDLSSFFDGVELSPESGSQAALRRILERWFGYVAVNSHAWEMLFRDGTGDEQIQEFRLAVSARAREVIAELIVGSGSAVPAEQVTPTAELLRAGLAGLALWSIDHPDVPRSTLIDVALRISTPAVSS